MSVDRSLKIKNALSRHRNVLSREERIEKLKEEERWTEGSSVTGLPKVAHRKIHSKKSEDKAAKAATEVGVEAGAEPADTTKAKTQNT